MWPDRSGLVVSLILSVLVAVVTGFLIYRANLPGTLNLNFKAVVGDDQLVFNEFLYQNPGGQGRFKIRDFQFYLSNIRLTGESGEHIETDSYHLVRFDLNEGNYTIVLNKIPRRNYRSIQFGIGVDDLANNSIVPSGDLDANSRMAWSWDVGYKFVLFEGGLELDDTLYPLVYHVGFDENYKVVEKEISEDLFDRQSAFLEITVDILKLFIGRAEVDMSGLPSVKFDREDAKLIADNYENMIDVRFEIPL